jgi:hypothetical protein
LRKEVRCLYRQELHFAKELKIAGTVEEMLRTVYVFKAIS